MRCNPGPFWRGLTLVPALFVAGAWSMAVQAEEPRARILIVVGPSDHPPGTHEVAAGGRLMRHCLEHAANVPGLKVDVVQSWPTDTKLLEQTATVVFIGDIFPPQKLPETASILKQLGAMMDRGCGLVCVHYATGLRAEDVAEDGEHPLLHWMGGYFATRCKHHQSIARIFTKATITPATPNHPVCRGWKAYTLRDEPYINNYFGKDGNKLAPNVVPIATSLLPPENPKLETVAWAIERPDGGRGLGIVMPHFYESWTVADLRKCILNGIVWTARLDVPETGVESTLPALETFGPAAVSTQTK